MSPVEGLPNNEVYKISNSSSNLLPKKLIMDSNDKLIESNRAGLFVLK